MGESDHISLDLENHKTPKTHKKNQYIDHKTIHKP